LPHDGENLPAGLFGAVTLTAALDRVAVNREADRVLGQNRNPPITQARMRYTPVLDVISGKERVKESFKAVSP
jgi:hypothetical protein